MRILGVVLPCLIVAALAPTAGATTGGGQSPLIQFDYYGFSVPPEPTKIGDEFTMVGVLSPGTTSAPVTMDFAANEYTVYVHGLVVSDIVINGPLIETHYTGGFVDIYEDPSFNAPFQHNSEPGSVAPLDPAEVPGNFTDGTLFLRFRYIDYITLWFESAGLGSIAFTASELRSTRIGLAAPELISLFMVAGWHNGGGYTNDPGAFIPPGYGNRYDALIRWESPLPVEETSWGAIKGLHC